MKASPRKLRWNRARAARRRELELKAIEEAYALLLDWLSELARVTPL